MGWETDVTEHPCHCGKGTFVLTSRSDDWGRSEHSGEIRCVDCSSRYEFKEWQKHDGDWSWGFVKRLTAEEREQIRREASERQRVQEEAVRRARGRYGDALVEVLASYGSRKAVWAVLQKAQCTSSEAWSFAAFNRLVQSDGRAEAIRRMISAENAPRVAKLIKELKS